MADASFEIEFKGKRYKDAEAGLKAYAERTGKMLDSAVPILQTNLRWYLDQVASAMGSRHGHAWPGGTTDSTLSRRSGALMESVKDSVRVDGSTIESVQGHIGGNKYARIQEYGGTITPKNSKYLAIPLDAALNSDGTPKKIGPRQWENTFVAKSKAGNLIIFQRQGRKVVPLYVLKSKVYIPPRLGLGDTLKTGMSLFVDRTMSAMLKAMKSS